MERPSTRQAIRYRDIRLPSNVILSSSGVGVPGRSPAVRTCAAQTACQDRVAGRGKTGQAPRGSPFSVASSPSVSEPATFVTGSYMRSVERASPKRGEIWGVLISTQGAGRPIGGVTCGHNRLETGTPVRGIVPVHSNGTPADGSMTAKSPAPTQRASPAAVAICTLYERRECIAGCWLGHPF